MKKKELFPRLRELMNDKEVNTNLVSLYNILTALLDAYVKKQSKQIKTVKSKI